MATSIKDIEKFTLNCCTKKVKWQQKSNTKIKNTQSQKKPVKRMMSKMLLYSSQRSSYNILCVFGNLQDQRISDVIGNILTRTHIFWMTPTDFRFTKQYANFCGLRKKKLSSVYRGLFRLYCCCCWFLHTF